MENREKIKVVVFAIACFTAISIFAASHYRKRRRNQKASQTHCYLDSEDSKPQTTFKRVFADNSYSPFKHLKRSNEDKSLNSNPYEEEIMGLLKNPEIGFINFVNGEVDMDMEMGGSHIWVETKSQLEDVVKVLSKERVFGVDTEQHSLRSFLGFTALMQISTQSEDYLLDTIALHDVMGVLAPVFADPSICKVFHGADNDVLWLQRDFHIYVVNLFDTAKACEVLSKPHKSLAYLLETYCGVFANKMLQREDWRLRPLSEEMVQYARADTHYLLYIADCLTTELKAKDTACLDDKFHFALEARRRSNMVCLQLYTKEIEAFPGQSAASSILSRYLNGQGGVQSDSETKDLVDRLCMWRDFMARLHDESLRYVLSDQAIAALASKVPKTLIEIYDTISEVESSMDPTVASSFVSPSAVVCSHLEDFCYLLEAKTGNLDDLFMTILQKHLGPDGACPLSIYNYAILSKCNLKPTNGLSTKQNGGKGSKRIGRKASRQLFVQKFSCKSPVYHNCRIYASDGRLLCYCDRRKLEWYLRRDLAKLVEDNPPAIMLLFEPKGRPEDEDNDFYIQSKKNICVGCGERNHYLRYRIIPSCYRMHFPEHLKSHRSHDIVLLCVDCHEIAHSAAEKHKRQIAAEFGIPLFVKTVVDLRQKGGASGSVENHEQAGVSPLQLRTAAMALLRYGPMMPSVRREELTQVVMKYFGGREITQADLEKALLVGMSPHERRRLEKKRGISLRHCSEGVISNKAHESMSNSVGTSAITGTLNDNTKNGAQTLEEAGCSQQEDKNLPMQVDTGVTDTSSCCDLGLADETYANGSEDINFDKNSTPEKENLCVSNTDEDFESRRPSDEASDPNYSYGTAAPNHNHKLSLLGHGPHGKQVVDHLLKECGEDGIREFCQRWRHVFVEAVHPRFLPSGWDVKHRL